MSLVRGRSAFDPVAAGVRRGLTREMALEIWRGIQQEAVDPYGCFDEAEARDRFIQVADRAMARAA